LLGWFIENASRSVPEFDNPAIFRPAWDKKRSAILNEVKSYGPLQIFMNRLGQRDTHLRYDPLHSIINRTPERIFSSPRSHHIIACLL